MLSDTHIPRTSPAALLTDRGSMPDPASSLGPGRRRPAILGVSASYLIRPEVSRTLDASHRMTVLRAPLGFGKTAAVASWLKTSASRPAGQAPGGRFLARHTLSAPPTSSVTFWAALCADVAPVLAAHATAGADASATTTYEQVRALVATLTAPVLLVVDGLEAEVSTPTSDPSPVGDITTEIVDLLQLSPYLDVLLACRPYGPLAMDAIFGPDAQILDSAAFTLDAVDTLDLADAAGIPLTLAQAHHLQTKLWGWPALTCAVLIDLAGSESGYDDASWESAGDLLSSLDPQGTDPEVAHFIRQICLLDPLTGPLADRLTGSPYASRALADLERAGITRSHLQDGERHYTLHPAVVRAIRTRPAAAAEYAPAHRHAAKMFRTMPEHAVRHAVRAQDWDLVLSIAEASTVPLILDHPLTLFQALGHVPAARLSDHPGLFELHAALARFDNAMMAPPTCLPAPGTSLDPPALRRALTVATAQIIALRACHQDVAARELVDRCAQVLLHSETAAATSGTAAPLFLLHAGIARCLVGEVSAAISDFEWCFELSRAGGLDSVTRAAAEYSALARSVKGDITGAREALARSRGFSHALVALQFVDTRLDQLVGALLALDQLDLQTAQLLLPPADETYRRGVPPAWFVEAYVRAHIGLLSGDLFSATTGLGRVLRDRRTSLQRGTLSSQLLTATAATINVWGGNTTRAKNILDSIPHNPLINAVHADVVLQMGDVQGALAITEASLAAEAVPDRRRIETLITRCVAHARQGDNLSAEADLCLAIELADPLLLRPFLAAPRGLLADFAERLAPVAALLSRLEASGITLTPVEHQVLVVLTTEEQDLLRALDRGASIDTIATHLAVPVTQALTLVGDLFASLGVHDRLGAIAAGHMLGYLGTPGP